MIPERKLTGYLMVRFGLSNQEAKEEARKIINKRTKRMRRIWIAFNDEGERVNILLNTKP